MVCNDSFSSSPSLTLFPFFSFFITKDHPISPFGNSSQNRANFQFKTLKLFQSIVSKTSNWFTRRQKCFRQWITCRLQKSPWKVSRVRPASNKSDSSCHKNHWLHINLCGLSNCVTILSFELFKIYSKNWFFPFSPLSLDYSHWNIEVE